MPMSPDLIIFTLGLHEAQIDHLHTRIAALEGGTRRASRLPWRELLPGIWGLVLLALLALVAAGKITLGEAMSVMRAGPGS